MRLSTSAVLASLVGFSAAAAAISGDVTRPVPPAPIGADSAGMFFVKYPRSSLRLNEQGAVHYRLGVDEDGLATSCTVTKTSGFRKLDQLTCAAAVHHAKFKPALNDKGFPVPTTYEGKVDWKIR